ncbi:MAG: DUF692 domain-containing protein [Proteobacteria bacterium]|nr:DUF692 domain-containing protein [Pseudomonadota bacterium]
MKAEGRAQTQQSIYGVGVGLRPQHFSYIFKHRPKVPWFEILTDNYLVDGGPMLSRLEKIRADYPIVMHGVGLSIGSTDPLNINYLKKIRQLMEFIHPTFVSDHLCWSSIHGRYFHELLPLPYTEEALNHVVARVEQVQEILGTQILLENVSSYITYRESTMTEWEFLTEISKKSGCLILLDINNIYVSAYNHHFDCQKYLNHIPVDRVAQFHMAGCKDYKNYLLDSHGESIQSPVLNLYQQAIKRFGAIPTSLERDNNIPEFNVLFNEAQQLQEMMNECIYVA